MVVVFERSSQTTVQIQAHKQSGCGPTACLCGSRLYSSSLLQHIGFEPWALKMASGERSRPALCEQRGTRGPSSFSVSARCGRTVTLKTWRQGHPGVLGSNYGGGSRLVTAEAQVLLITLKDGSRSIPVSQRGSTNALRTLKRTDVNPFILHPMCWSKNNTTAQIM